MIDGENILNKGKFDKLGTLTIFKLLTAIIRANRLN